MSKKIFIVKSSTGFLLPGDAEAEEVVNKWKVGASYSLTYAIARNPKFHRMIFAIAGKVVENAPHDSYWHGKKPIHFIHAVELTIGMVEEEIDLSGQVHLRAKSVKFENMDDDEFKTIYDPVVTEGARILGISERELLEGAEVA